MAKMRTLDFKFTIDESVRTESVSAVMAWVFFGHESHEEAFRSSENTNVLRKILGHKIINLSVRKI